MSMISLKNVSKFYHNKTTISSGFTKLNLDLDMGEFVVITGESGSGKSTLLNVISGLDSYEEGEMYIDGEETSHYTEVDYENYRRKYIGNIFQHFNLVNSYTVYQNVELVLLLNGYKKSEIEDKILNIIETVGLTKFKNTKAAKLSGGQKQRVAIARALAKDTPIIVADEPTGNLDVQSARSIMKLLKDISKSKLVVIVTHNYEQVSEYATRKIAMNDGKIIEDKMLKEHEKCEADLVKYEDLTIFNKFRLGFRNAFNIKVKFALLFFVYFFLTLLVFSEYSSLQKQDFTDSLDGYNNMFNETSPNRVILNKKDKSIFTTADVAKLESISNVLSVSTSDFLLDMMGSLYSENYAIYLSGYFGSLNDLASVDEGRLPTQDDEIVIKTSRDSVVMFYKDELLNGSFNLQENYMGNDIDTIKVVGFVYSDDSDDYFGTFYLSDALVEKLNYASMARYNVVTLTVDDKAIEMDSYGTYNAVMPSSKVKDGEIYTYFGLNSYCNNFSCANKTSTLKVENMYYEDSLDLKITHVVDGTNYKDLLGIQNYENVANVSFISENDYKALFNKGDYQVSVFMDDLRKDTETLQELEKLGYDYYYMKDNLINPSAKITGVIKIVRNVMFMGATVALFFVAYFIIKIILKSRNVYYSTIRILGATKTVARQLLNIELLVDINMAFFAFVGLILLSQTNVIEWQYIKSLVTYFTFSDYIAVYVVLVVMSLAISNRYAHKLFKDSVMSTYREEV